MHSENGPTEKRRSLGRGLSALIPPKPVEAPGRSVGVKVDIELVHPSDQQPRQLFDEDGLKELSASIAKHGILQPILVRKRAADRYEIIAGERRWRAAQRAGLKQIDVVVSDAAAEDTLTLALVENLQRRDLNAIEEAEAFQRLHRDLGYSQAEIADAVGKDRSSVANALRLLKLPESVRGNVLEGSLSMGHARALLGLESDSEIERAAREAARKGWSVRQTEEVVARRRAGQSEKDPATKTRQAGGETAAERDVRERLQRALGTKVELSHRGGRGTLTVHFESFDALDALLQRFGA